MLLHSATTFLTSLLILLCLAPPTVAQTPRYYTVWSSVIFQRTGERTPEVIGDSTIPITLTSIGANQAQSAGQFFRSRYIGNATSTSTSTNGAGNSVATLVGLDPDVYDSLQMYASALDQQWNVATAQAWLQGFYPPYAPGSGAGAELDGQDVLANDSYVTGPLNGYQYPYVHTAGALDPNFIYMGANWDCPAFARQARAYTTTPQFSVTQQQFEGLYDAIGSAVLGGVIPPDTWDYWNAYAIYDYLVYQNAHNSTVADALASLRDVKTNTSYLTQLSWLASQQQYAQLGNLTAVNPYTGASSLQTVTGSISTLPGNMLASKVLAQFEDAIASGAEMFKVNLLFADFYPLLSFFALADLPALNPNFYGIPDYASSAVWELFSYENSTNATFTSDTDLYVRFSFRNGSSTEDDFQSYPIFGRDPDASEVSWDDFRTEMAKISFTGNDVVPAWCGQCGSPSLFCAAYNSSLTRSSSTTGQHRDGEGMAPAVAGVIGAIVALAIAGILFGLTMVLGGVRVRRDRSRKRSDMGGFKGGQKMASDQDLTIPKGKDGVAVGASVVEGPMSPMGGHERVGSWEMKDAERGLSVRPSMEQRPSMEERRDPFSDPTGLRPVQSREVV
ncbi:hypothetical protein DOTSEDRAFT_37408 [Dothistroma septosporum NZE10]|uniref:Histidine acid phosphatase-like protein n=1 Tax=Dothistroma septosporum (strain NZE10 / CBS 128990) TaxID=675120 RepID=N1PET6_DOTSN|nr:hypothetical protein DOTSEDRAFT_37408 [Dothistroma septosporum NZE10]